MARAFAPDVRTILPVSTTLTDVQIDAAINAATVIVNRIAANCASHLDDCTLQQVEVYLAAHFAAATENTLTLKSESDPCHGGSATYGFKFGEGIMGTPFGQMANTLSGGCLADLDKARPDFLVLGCH